MTVIAKVPIPQVLPGTYWVVSQGTGLMYLGVKNTQPNESKRAFLTIQAEAVLVAKEVYTYIPDLRGFIEGRYQWRSISVSQFECVKHLALSST